MHLDENTPHIHAVIVPVVAEKLNCRALLGDREKMREMQSSFAKAMEGLGLERGIMHSKARHVPIRQFYSRVNHAQGEAEAVAAAIQRAPRLQLEPVPMFATGKWKETQESRINQEMQQYAAAVKDHLFPLVHKGFELEDENRRLKGQLQAQAKELEQLKGRKQLREDLAALVQHPEVLSKFAERYGYRPPAQEAPRQEQDQQPERRRGLRM